ncbi:MAG TPA: hypothetical protein VFA09_02125 [Ktedonobacteraceae bacterium]|jgi:hypothetical protein|nr:hypothetical protein [Ktedonobacteraceae bacterium]
MNEQKIGETIDQMPKPIKWVVPDSIRTDHATHLVVQQQGSEFTLMFFEIQQPLLTGTPDEQISQYKAASQIASIVEPFATAQRYEEHMPAKSSREVIINVTHGGKPKPKAHLD